MNLDIAAGGVRKIQFNPKSGKWEQLICHQVKLPKLAIVFNYMIFKISWQNKCLTFFHVYLQHFFPCAVEKTYY